MLQLPAVTGPPGIPGLQAGRDDEASFLNFQNWLKQLVLSHSRDSVVKLGNGTEIPCLFHKLSQENHSAIEGTLSHLYVLQKQILDQGVDTHSAGIYLSVEGAGVGSLSMIHKSLGPFLSDSY
uniref:Uncharacterized protein n=1 Tax=Amphimedon queenslandica TaxID=400682 RepID=A0A1X7TQB6_AMPQE